jgi:hypothetical protein
MDAYVRISLQVLTEIDYQTVSVVFPPICCIAGSDIEEGIIATNHFVLQVRQLLASLP